MKKQFAVLFAVIGAGLFATQPLSAITLSFANIVGANVEFIGLGGNSGNKGGNFRFNAPASGNDFRITASDFIGDSVGDMGAILGTFHIGTITSLPGGLQKAPVTGSGSVVIHGGAGTDLTANLDWNQIQTSGTAGSVNLSGVLNLSSIHYTGGQHDLARLAAYPHTGVAVVSFTFIPARSLTQLTAKNSDKKTSFSGTYFADRVPDGGATLLLLAAGIMGLGLAGRSRKSE